LERIEDRTYGQCLRCDQAISPRRLEAVPWAAFCIRCQEIEDKERLASGRDADGLAKAWTA